MYKFFRCCTSTAFQTGYSICALIKFAHPNTSRYTICEHDNFTSIFFNITMYSISVGLLSTFGVYILLTKDMLVFRIFIYNNLRSILYCTFLKTLQREFAWPLQHRFLWHHQSFRHSEYFQLNVNCQIYWKLGC